MQGIYTDEGTLDYAAAADQLAKLRGLNNATLKADAVALVNAAALLDIAVSLNALVTMAGKEFDLGIEGEVDDDTDPGEGAGPDGEPGEEPEEPFELGEYVRPREGGAGPFGPISSIGESEGSTWLAIDLSDNEHERQESARVWASGYERFTPGTQGGLAGTNAGRNAAIDDRELDEDFVNTDAEREELQALVDAGIDITRVECGEAFTLGNGDAALCQRKPGHKGDHKLKGNK